MFHCTSFCFQHNIFDRLSNLAFHHTKNAEHAEVSHTLLLTKDEITIAVADVAIFLSSVYIIINTGYTFFMYNVNVFYV